MSFPTVKGMLNDTVDETSRSPMAVKSGRRSGRASATILRKAVEVGMVPSALCVNVAGRKRERMERRAGVEWGVDVEVGEGGDDADAGARVPVLVTKKRDPCTDEHVGREGYRLLVEGFERYEKERDTK